MAPSGVDAKASAWLTKLTSCAFQHVRTCFLAVTNLFKAHCFWISHFASVDLVLY